jgi:MFS superfamily sulfate permease-like transporter
VVEKVIADVRQIGQINLYALLVSAAVIVLILGSRKISKKIPGALIAVIGAIAAKAGRST